MLRFKSTVLFFAAVLLITACGESGATVDAPVSNPVTKKQKVSRKTNPVKTIHVVVALCDNESQGIVPVSKSLGDGNNLDSNLYWGARYGVRTFFDKSDEWKRVQNVKSTVDQAVLERIVYRHATGAVLFADAYRGRKIAKGIADFLDFSAGRSIQTVDLGVTEIQIGGGADLIAFVGHNGLMDFKSKQPTTVENAGKRDSIVLACFSKKYFSKVMDKNSVNPILWTTNFMAPEAYVLHAALEDRLNGGSRGTVVRNAAGAYAKYQKISLRASSGLFTSGW